MHARIPKTGECDTSFQKASLNLNWVYWQDITDLSQTWPHNHIYADRTDDNQLDLLCLQPCTYWAQLTSITRWAWGMSQGGVNINSVGEILISHQHFSLSTTTVVQQFQNTWPTRTYICWLFRCLECIASTDTIPEPLTINKVEHWPNKTKTCTVSILFSLST